MIKHEGLYEIQDYKGQTIYYDENIDKFVCDISAIGKKEINKHKPK